MLKSTPTIYNIEAGLSFADALAQGVWERAGQDPLKLSEYTILLPSRRACRTLRDAFLRLSGGTAVLLPRLKPIGDVDAEEVSMLLAGEDDIESMMDLPPAASRLERQILLARVIEKTNNAQSFDQAMLLAKDLGVFLDEVETEGLDFAALQNLVPDKFSTHWQKTLEFLKILTEFWPQILKERGIIDHALRRNLLLKAQVEAWAKNPPQTPVLAAGSTGNVPAAAELQALVARLPQGALILPGLDIGMDDDSWERIAEDHPQYNMKLLLGRMNAQRSDVQDWALSHKPPVNKDRVRLMFEAMRPADTTEKWRALTTQDIGQNALHGFSRIDCDTPQEEADVIALLLRETLETPAKTAALITPDRRLARRVSLSLRRWGIQVEDSGGQPLTELMVGSWLMLTAEMAQEGLSPIALLSFLKHPFMAAALPPEDLRDMVRALDQFVLRGPRPSTGFAGLRNAIAVLPVKLEKTKQDLYAWIDRIETYMKGFTDMMAQKSPLPFHALLTAHIRMAENLADTGQKKGEERLWVETSGEAASDLLTELRKAASDVPELKAQHYVALLGALLKSVTVRPRYGAHPRLFILGQIEARLYSADMVILGGLNEGTWPALPDHDPWMSRPMRKDFGLPSPERTLSLAAHDFVQASTAPEVFITRAKKVDGTPTVPARWLMRLDTVLKAVGYDWPMGAAIKYRNWVKAMDAPEHITPTSRPAPTPPVASRPTELSVTRIETWMRDPYQIYAEKILRLRALDPIDADPGGAERGTFIHKALEDLIKVYPKELPPDAAQKLLQFGKAALADMRVPSEVEAFWWPRFEKIADIFVRQEQDWRVDAKPYLTEISGAFDMDGFTLTGKADRIDQCRDGTYAIIDYKSGYAPTNTEVRQGLSPQLPLEAMMLENGAFKDIAAGGKTSQLVYWKVTGSGQKPVEMSFVKPKDYTIDDMVADAYQGLSDLIEKFKDETTPYISQPRADAKPKFSDYEHLARVKEWSISGDDEGGEAAE